MPGVEAAASNTTSSSASSYSSLVTKFSQAPLRTVVDTVVSTATPVVNTALPYVTPVVQKVTPFVPSLVKNATNAGVEKVLSYSTPANAAIDAVDAKFAATVAYIQKEGVHIPTYAEVSQVLPASVVHAINQFHVPHVTVPSVSDVKASALHFYNTAVQTLLELKEKNSTPVKREEFIKELRAKLGAQWDERLQKPAEQIFEQGKQLLAKAKANVPAFTTLQNLRAQLGENFEKPVLDVYHRRVEAPALQLYHSLLEYFTPLYQKGQAQAASLKEYLNGLKATLGKNYSEKLEPYVAEAYNSVKAVLDKFYKHAPAVSSQVDKQAEAAANATKVLVNGH